MKLFVTLVLCLSVCSGSAFGEKYSQLDIVISCAQFTKGVLKMVDLLLDIDCANSKYPYGVGGKLVHMCAINGNPECVRKVAAKGGDIFYRDNRNKTALDYAELLAFGSSPEYNKVLGFDYEGVGETLKKLQNSTDYVVGRDCYLNNTQWNQIVRKAFKGFFDEIIEGGVNREIIYPIHVTGGTHLHNCAMSNFYLCAKILLEAGVDSEIRDVNGKTAYELAIDGGYLEVAELIKQASVAAVTTVRTLEVTSDKAVDSVRKLDATESTSDKIVAPDSIPVLFSNIRDKVYNILTNSKVLFVFYSST